MNAEDTQFVPRCPYCALGRHFRPLTAGNDAEGRFVCAQCGHTARPGELLYLCSCNHCLRLSRLADVLEKRWVR